MWKRFHGGKDPSAMNVCLGKLGKLPLGSDSWAKIRVNRKGKGGKQVGGRGSSRCKAMVGGSGGSITILDRFPHPWRVRGREVVDAHGKAGKGQSIRA